MHLSSISTTMIDDDDTVIVTPKAPRGKRSDLTEKDLEEFVRSFSSMDDTVSDASIE
jgi:hypothetical protein